MKNIQLVQLIKRVVEITMPNLRVYYRMVRKAKIVRTYASNGQYWADVQPLKNDESEDTAEPVVSKVEIPILWGGEDRGVVCPPAVGTRCDLSYYDGDPNYPRISNFRWQNNGAPACEVGAFIIQADPTTYIKIDAEKNLIEVTSADSKREIDGNASETIGGNKSTQIGGNGSYSVDGDQTESAGGTWTIKAPNIVLQGNMQSTGAGGGVGISTVKSNTEQTGSITLVGHLQCSSLSVAGDAAVGGNCHASSRSGASI
jgi:hypothetical protein